MGIVSSVNENITQEYYNNITQVSQQYCQASTTEVQGTSVVIVDGSSIDGDFTGVENAVTTDTSCMMVSYMENNITDILEATLDQSETDETDIFSAFSTTLFSRDKATVEEVITNNIFQINQAVCQASTVESTEGQYVYVTDTDVGGDFIGVSSESDTSANCTMSNVARNVTRNQAKGTSTQDVLDEGMFATFFNSIAAIIGVVIIIAIIAAVAILSIKLLKKPSAEQQQASTPTTGSITIPL